MKFGCKATGNPVYPLRRPRPCRGFARISSSPDPRPASIETRRRKDRAAASGVCKGSGAAGRGRVSRGSVARRGISTQSGRANPNANASRCRAGGRRSDRRDSVPHCVGGRSRSLPAPSRARAHCSGRLPRLRISLAAQYRRSLAAAYLLLFHAAQQERTSPPSLGSDVKEFHHPPSPPFPFLLLPPVPRIAARSRDIRGLSISRKPLIARLASFSPLLGRDVSRSIRSGTNGRFTFGALTRSAR